jgi:nucleoid-associated protein YgaU
VATAEPEQPPPPPARRISRFWLVLVVVLLVAVLVGAAVGVSLGTRQSGPLAGSGEANGRPTIVVPTVVAVASVSPASSAATPTAVTAVAPAKPAAAEYVVQPGDTLRSIAQQQYGDAEQWPRIYQANRDAIGPDPDALKAGTRLELPDATTP